MEIEPLLYDIGLTKNEVKIYLCILEIGETTTGPIIKKSGLHTSKVYDALNRLIEKGLASYILVSEVKRFRAVEPERIIDFLDEKKKIIDGQKEKINQVLPILKQFKQLNNSETSAEVFQGWKGVETVYKILRDSSEKGDLTLTVGASMGEEPEKVSAFFIKHVKEMTKKGIRENIIFNENTRGIHNLERLYSPKLFQVRYLENTSPSEINIWKDNVMIVILTKIPTVVRINNKVAADSFRQYFDVMWSLAKP
jgi:HTH-type transcriptional regulator, sugar sensing transcriptional regulator